jgi:hypothetical protein
MSSKIWLYQTNRALASNEQEVLQNQLNEFASNWKAHGKNLEAKFWFHNPFLLICEVDESLWGASGCSIDAKVHFLKELGNRYDSDFFVRMKTIVQIDNSFQQMNFDEVKTVQGEFKVFNPGVTTSEQMQDLFTTSAESPMKRLFV